MEIGAHLPLIEFDGTSRTHLDLRTYAGRAAALGYSWLSANDHLVFRRPWLDGPTALAATLDAAAGMTVATTVALPVVRGPGPTAKMLSALRSLSEGRFVAGLGPGSSRDDYAVVGVPFEERWKRFDAAVREVRDLLGLDAPPIWLASWGSPAGMRRVARLGDGWLASGYNTTPERFADGLASLPHGFPNAIATMWLHVTESHRVADRVIGDVLAPLLRRPADEVRELSLPIGPASLCAERIAAYAEAGAERILVWPVGDELRQLELFREVAGEVMATPPRTAAIRR
jgi:alkanesulfonate monooxygenase SsuD/methylene tetrahydromethanopterin reductase-like flavin-dependent oxidoreductase (luciferase family)